MRMELIQPFINASDAVLAETLKSPTRMGDLSMDQDAYRCKGMAALVGVTGDIEGRVIFDLESPTAAVIASALTGMEVAETDEMVRETVCELANLVIGNAVTSLNDQGFSFKIHPPQLHSGDDSMKGSEDTEAVVMTFQTSAGDVYMNIAMRYNRRRKQERTAVGD